MRTTFVTNTPFDKLSNEACRALFIGLPSLRGMVMSWYGGGYLELLSQPSTLRRLVVRALKEVEAENSASISYGGTY